MGLSIIWLNIRLLYRQQSLVSLPFYHPQITMIKLADRAEAEPKMARGRRATPGNQMHLNVTTRSSVRLQVPNFLCACVLHTWSDRYCAHACCTRGLIATVRMCAAHTWSDATVRMRAAHTCATRDLIATDSRIHC